jgi:hypothetical protein
MERGQFDTLNTQIHDRSLSWLAHIYGQFIVVATPFRSSFMTCHRICYKPNYTVAN